MIILGISIARRGEGFEPVKVLQDLSFKYIYPEAEEWNNYKPLTSAEAIKEGRSLARAHNLPFRSRISAFKKEKYANA